MTQSGERDQKDLGQIASDAVTRYQQRKASLAQVELSNGVVIEILPLAEEPIRRAVLAIPLPEIPTVKIGDLEIEEPNPDDPDYVDAHTQAMFDRTQVGFRVATILGTKCKKAPKGYKPQDDRWIEDLAVAGVTVDISSDALRYREWLYLYALADTMDRTRTAQSVLKFSFVEVAELSQAIQFFWDRGVRDAAAGGEVEGAGVEVGGGVARSAPGFHIEDGGTGDGSASPDSVADVADDEPRGSGGSAGVEAGT